MKKLKRMATNMFHLFPGIAVQKILEIFDFGSQFINWVACSMTQIFINTCIFRQSKIALLCYFLFLLLQFMVAHQHITTNQEQLPQTSYQLGSSTIISLYSHVILLSFSFNNCSYFVMGVHFIKDLTEWLNLYLNSTYCYILNFF